MSYKDDQQQKDTAPKGDRDYTEEERQQREQRSHMATGGGQQTQSSQSNGRKGLFSRMRDALTGGAANTAKNAKQGFATWKSEGGLFGKHNIVKGLTSPKRLALLAVSCGMGTGGLLGMFSTYKNDGAIIHDMPLSCESGYFEFERPVTEVKNVKQETVDVMYDVFCRNLGYSEDFLCGMLSCMTAECNLNYSNIERDWSGPNGADANEKMRYELFYNIAGGGDYEVIDTNPTTEQVLDAYYNYSDVMGVTWITGAGDKNVGVYTCDNGRFGAGIGLIGWTGNAGVDFLTGVDKIYQDYDWYDLPYQCAYILAGFKKDETDSMMQNGEWRTQLQSKMDTWFAPIGTTDPTTGEALYKFVGHLYHGAGSTSEENRNCPGGDACPGNRNANLQIPQSQVGAYAATKWYLEKYVNGGPSDTQKYNPVTDRWNNVEGLMGMIEKAKVNAKYTQDVTSMADLIYNNTINDQVYEAQNAQICQNDTKVDPVDIAMAAVSISWLERADYLNDSAAYGEYKRSELAPDLVNDWDFVNTRNNGEPGGTKENHAIGPYTSGTLKGLMEYGVKNCDKTHELVACTEFYYYAHLIAFPGETDTGYFSSCDRGTATAVRIAGADDNFPGGDPKLQLEYLLGASSTKDRSDQQNGQSQKLWKPAGFLRGSDWYSFEGRNSIPDGVPMMSWNQALANGLKELVNQGKWDVQQGSMAEDNLRFPLTNSTTQNHILTHVGGASVRTFWGTKYLLEQYTGFDDADPLVRGELTVQAPKVMQDGANIKARWAADAFDANKTFYMSQQEHANDNGATIDGGGSFAASLITHRADTQYNQKTGLPEFKAWEQIFMRLVHNVDDDRRLNSTKYATDKDGYKDNIGSGVDYEDHIVQYGPDGEYGTAPNRYFTTDWDKAGGTGALYAEPSDAAWYDDNTNKWTAWANDVNNAYWRYELASDFEYRTNQLERFSMAMFIVSYATENDANAYQNNENAASKANGSGHILGNVYRRMSRIGEKSDTSGRYYYYNTVVSNDMFQDLVQLYVTEGPDVDEIEDGLNFGPYYDLSKTIVAAKSQAFNGKIGDRRYGLTNYDIENIFAGFAREDADDVEKAGFGTDTGRSMNFGIGVNDAGSFTNRMYKYMSTPLYDLRKEIEGYGKPTAEGHEGSHVLTDAKDVYYGIDGTEPVAQELYGVNPYIMIKEYMGDAETRGKNKVGANQVETDRWEAFMDRHYYADELGNINMYAYAVLGMNPSTGKLTTIADYENALKNLRTIHAGEGKSDGPYDPNDPNQYMISCLGKLSYTDYIYGDNPAASEAMGKRLLYDDDRSGLGMRDDYNRREYIMIPYYHTHAANCFHPKDTADLTGWDTIGCNRSTSNVAEDASKDGRGEPKIDTCYVNNNDCKDALATISFDDRVSNRGKYTQSEIDKLSMFGGNVRYFIKSGSGFSEVQLTDTPPETVNGVSVHVVCHGESFSNDPDDPNDDNCPYCSASIRVGESCDHPCDECREKYPQHGANHVECNDGEHDGDADECHEKYGCSLLEYYYHTGTPVYMLVQVVDNPKEDIDSIDPAEYLGDGCDKGNLLQLIQYDMYGCVEDDYLAALKTLANPNAITDADLLSIHGSPHAYTNNGLNPGYSDKAMGYFTIEGNLITRDFDKRGEVAEGDKFCTTEDLSLLESVRNRIGAGKRGTTEEAHDILQDFIQFKTGIEGVEYDTTTREGSNKTYGEIKITGASHQLSPQSQNAPTNGSFKLGNALWLCGGYGDIMDGGSGPDTAFGNKTYEFGNSLIRFLAGDEHVYHVSFGAQNKDIVTGTSQIGKDLGYDFEYFEEFVDVDPDAMYIDCVTGELTMHEYNIGAEAYRNEDGTYEQEADKYKNKPLPLKNKGSSYTPLIARGTDNGDVILKRLFSSETGGLTVEDELWQRYKDDDVPGQDEGLNGDYGVWITHASRGDRGMKTQYIVLKTWFGDAYDGTNTSPTMQYMAFEPVMQKDEVDADGDGDTEEPFIYTAVDDVTYGQASNSRWRNLIELYNESLAREQQ